MSQPYKLFRDTESNYSHAGKIASGKLLGQTRKNVAGNSIPRMFNNWHSLSTQEKLLRKNEKKTSRNIGLD